MGRLSDDDAKGEGWQGRFKSTRQVGRVGREDVGIGRGLCSGSGVAAG